LKRKQINNKMKSTANFLIKDQVEALTQFSWQAIPSGAHFRLEKGDFKKDAVWEALCKVAECDQDKEEMIFLFIATKQYSR
jgi:hypothetical protein